MVSKELVKLILTGAFVGAVFGHPLMMVIAYLMSDISHSHASMGKVGIVSEILKSFSVPMLPWSLAFAVFGGLTGFYYYKTKKAEQDKLKLISQLQESLAKIKVLSGFLPICSSCKKIRDDKGYWNQIELYIREHSSADFSHGICPECAKKLYPDLYKEDPNRKDT